MEAVPVRHRRGPRAGAAPPSAADAPRPPSRGRGMRARALADLLVSRFEENSLTVENGFYNATKPTPFRFRENGQRLLFEDIVASDLAGELGLSVRDLSELERGNPADSPAPSPAAPEPASATPAAPPSQHRQNAIDAVTEALLDNIVEADDP